MILIKIMYCKITLIAQKVNAHNKSDSAKPEIWSKFLLKCFIKKCQDQNTPIEFFKLCRKILIKQNLSGLM